MKKNQAGFFMSDADFIKALILFALVFGFIVYVAVPWLWRLAKPLLHSLTAP